MSDVSGKPAFKMKITSPNFGGTSKHPNPHSPKRQTHFWWRQWALTGEKRAKISRDRSYLDKSSWMKTHLYTILQHCLQVFSAAYATAECSPMQACTRTVSCVRRIMLCFFPRDLWGERELRWSYSWTKQWSVAQRESGEQRVTCMGPLYWYPSERRGEQTKHTSVALTIMPSSPCIHGAHISSGEINWAGVNTEAMMVFWSSSKVVISAAKCRRAKTSMHTRQDNQVCGRRSINQSRQLPRLRMLSDP